MRHDLATVNRLRDGVTTTAAGLSPIVTRVALMLPATMIEGTEHEQWLKATREVQLPTAPLFGLISVPDATDRSALVDAGRLWQRLHLAGAQSNVAMQPLNQMMEMSDRDRVLGRPSPAGTILTELAGFADAQPVFGFRLGYAQTEAPLSPRRSANQVISS